MSENINRIDSHSELVYERRINDFTICYYVTSGCFESGEEKETRNYYGVALEKKEAGPESDVVERSGVTGVSEAYGEAIRVLKILCDMEVTPISLFEVIDEVVWMVGQ